MSSLPISHNEEYDEYDVFPLQNTMLPYDFHEIPTILNTAMSLLFKELINILKSVLFPLLVVKHTIFIIYYKESKSNPILFM